MAFASSQHVDASQGVFTNIFGAQNTVTINYTPSGPSKSNAATTISHLLTPYHNELFTGREADLETLNQYFSPRNTSRPSRRFLVHGVGGAGKTQMCSRFAEQISDRFWRVFWVDATTVETLELSFQAIAMDPDAQVDGVEPSPQSALRWLLVVKHDWLIVLDNVGDENSVAKYMPGNRGNILFTSRNPNLARLVSATNCIEINDMEEEDAISLLLKSSRNNEQSISDREAARPIVKALFCLPLAVDQAGAAISSGLCRIDDYLHMYDRRRQELLADHTFKGASNYGRAVYGTWDLSFTAIRQMGSREAESAIFILRTFAFFHHENISEEIFKRAAEATEGRVSSLIPQLFEVDQNGIWDSFLFRGGIRILLSYSLVKKSKIGDIFSLHPLVHWWSRDNMSDEERRTSSSVASSILSSTIFCGFTSADFAYRRTLVPHINVVKSWSELCYDEEVYIGFALVFGESGHWKDAEKLEVEVLETRKRILGEEHPSTLTIMNNLALMYSNQGRRKDAEKLQVRVLETQKRVLGEEHPSTLTIMSNLASTYSGQGRLKDAEKLQVEVLETQKRVLGEEHLDTLTTMNNLASTYSHQGRLKDAEKLQVEVLETQKRVLGEEHPDTLTIMNNLASTYSGQGRLKDAEKLEVEVLATRKRVLGEEHLDTLITMNNLASTYSHQGRLKDAEKLEVQVLETQKKVIGEEHLDTLTTMNNLALMYSHQGRLKDAEKLQVQVLETAKRFLGEEHPDTLTTMNNLASTYSHQGRLKDAEKLQVQVFETAKRVIGEEHPSTLTIMNNLALMYWNQGRRKDAEKLKAQVLEMAKRVLGEEHPSTLTSMSNLASTYSDQGRLEDAEKLQVQVLKTEKRVIGEEHPSTLTTRSNLASTYSDQGRLKDAEKLGAQAMEMSMRVLGEEHPRTLVIVRNLARYQNQGQNEPEEVQNNARVSRGIAALSRMFKSLRKRRAS